MQGASYRPEVDGLRALAVLAVVLYHADVDSLSGGFVGFDVFFVLSGYLITRLLLAELERAGSVDFGSFYVTDQRRRDDERAWV